MDRKNILNDLRSLLRRHQLDGLIVPHSDAYQNEFIPACDQRLEFLTGFSGSAGVAIILDKKAVVMSDGRYTLQLKAQVDPTLFTVADSTKTSIAAWLKDHAAHGARIGYDPRLHTPQQVSQWEDILLSLLDLVPTETNMIDHVWHDRPAEPMGQVEIFPLKIAGLSATDKRTQLAKHLKEKGIDSFVLTAPDSVAWLLNIRGNDVLYNPIPLCSAILNAHTAQLDLFIHAAKLNADVRTHLGNDVAVHAPQDFEERLRSLTGVVGFDPVKAAVSVTRNITQAKSTSMRDPCVLLRACKTDSEHEAMRNAHKRDGVAVTKFLHWLKTHPTPHSLNELVIAEYLEDLRRAHPSYRGGSFATICGWAANGAIIHYRATQDSYAVITPPGLLLVDSGGQYEDGTTDITRVIAIGAPTSEMKYHYTLVLKAHIALSAARFPKGTNGAQLDAMTRAPLWAQGLDYAHGTGHGVGCYLSVHEEAASISPRGTEPMLPGMVVSNEPGFYRADHYGIRIENLILCRDEGRMTSDGAALLSFETLTRAPYDPDLILKDILTQDEQDWLKAYHAVVVRDVAPHLTSDESEWLMAQTL
jgi:Xaa-Pro aminopeptidase